MSDAKTMRTLVKRYLEDQKYAWAESTKKAAEARLNKYADLTGGSPEDAWEALKGLKPYTRATTWTNLVSFIDWAIEEGHIEGPNSFKKFRKRNARLFKHVYERKIPTVTFEQARALIDGIEEPTVRNACLDLLTGGLRYVDYARREGDYTRGKGGKLRKVYGINSGADRPVGYATIYRSLQELGLTPHMLRKIRMNQLASKGMDTFSLMEFAGWASPQTAMSYIKASEDKIQKFLND